MTDTYKSKIHEINKNIAMIEVAASNGTKELCPQCEEKAMNKKFVRCFYCNKKSNDELQESYLKREQI